MSRVQTAGLLGEVHIFDAEDVEQRQCEWCTGLGAHTTVRVLRADDNGWPLNTDTCETCALGAIESAVYDRQVIGRKLVEVEVVT